MEEVYTRDPVLLLFFPRGLQNRLKSDCLRATVIFELWLEQMQTTFRKETMQFLFFCLDS